MSEVWRRGGEGERGEAAECVLSAGWLAALWPLLIEVSEGRWTITF